MEGTALKCPYFSKMCPCNYNVCKNKYKQAESCISNAVKNIYIFFIYKIKIIGSMFYNKTISDFLLQNVMFNLKCYWLFLSIKIILKETYYAPFYNM